MADPWFPPIRSMSPEEFETLASGLYADADRWRWQTLLGQEIGVAPRTVRSWLNGRSIPAPVCKLLRILDAQRLTAPTSEGKRL